MPEYEDELHPRLRRWINPRQRGTTTDRLRRRRFEVFLDFVADLPRPLRILDLGGEEVFWHRMGLTDPGQVRVTLLNRYPVPVQLDGFSAHLGDATAMPEFAGESFDIVFSNSVIEHVGNWEAQQRMADETMRVGRRYFVQTPNRYFPLEPHFLLPFFQFYPLWLRVWLMRRFHLGWYRPIPDLEVARRHILAHRLLSRAELVALFPGCRIYEEKVAGLTKSLAAMGSNKKIIIGG